MYVLQQDAQLSQRDRAAGCVTVFAKSRRLELGDSILRAFFNGVKVNGLVQNLNNKLR